jgi:hypothetical protein
VVDSPPPRIPKKEDKPAANRLGGSIILLLEVEVVANFKSVADTLCSNSVSGGGTWGGIIVIIMGGCGCGCWNDDE